MGDFNINNETYEGNFNFNIAHNKLDLSDFSSNNVSENFGFMGNETSKNETAVHLGRDEFLAKIEQLILILIFIFTISGNFLVLVGIYFRKEKMSRMYYFILHLAIADLTTAFFNVLTQLFWELTHRFQGGVFMCKFVKYTQILGPYASSYILVMTAMDRYQAICYPLSNCSWTARRSKIMLGTSWTLAILFCLPQLYIFTYQEISPGGNVFDCWATFIPEWGEKAYITWYCITMFIIPLIILVFAYTCITRAIWVNFNMKNAIMKEENSMKRFVREQDSDDDPGLDCSFDDNESTVIQNRKRFSEKHRSLRRNDGSMKTKNLEVSWHQRKQGTKTRASKSKNDDLSKSRCQSCAESQSNQNRNDSITQHSRYFEKGQCFHAMNTSNDQKKKKEILIPIRESHPSSTLLENRAFNESNESDIKILTPDRRQKWNSLSSKSTTKAHFENTANDDLEHHEVTGNYKKVPNPSLHKTSSVKTHFLTRLSNGNSTLHDKMRTKSTKSYTLTQSQPRTHSVKGISRAKIKTVKLTVTVICCYIICSTPFIAALLWSAYDPYAKTHPFWFGPTFTILTLLASLNSCVNSWIVLFFNPNLLQSFVRGTCPRLFRSRSRKMPISINVSQRKLLNNKNKLVGTNSNQMMGATSVTGLSPLMNRFSPEKKDATNVMKNVRDSSIELIPPVVNSSHSNNSLKEKENTIPIETSFIGI